jgi:hypothetical protein
VTGIGMAPCRLVVAENIRYRRLDWRLDFLAPLLAVCRSLALRRLLLVIAGLDPAIHRLGMKSLMDARVKPAHSVTLLGVRALKGKLDFAADPAGRECQVN